MLYRAAKADPDRRFHALRDKIYREDVLWRAWIAVRRNNGAPGIDKTTLADVEEYGVTRLLGELASELRAGTWRPLPARKVLIPKPGSTERRPLAIATLEDKIVQRAVVEVLNAIYEEDFLGFSYGFRPGRKPHDALDALAVGIEKRKVNWILDADIRGFYDAIDHEWLRKFVEHRIADKRVLRLIQKWLNAGVIEDGSWSASEEGAPQGASASPLLANVYLHYVFDLWARHWRNRQAQGDVIIVRFADDIVVGFQDRSDAERFRADLVERFARFNLELNAEKTRLIEFGRFAAQNRRRRGLGRPETFSFLGFTHICGKTRTGRFALRRKTIAKRMAAKLREVNASLRQRRHWPIPEQGQWLGSVVRGHTAYYAVPGNIAAVSAFRKQVTRHWDRALRRRSQRHRVTWERMSRLEARWLPPARITHPWPNVRFDARTRGRSPVR